MADNMNAFDIFRMAKDSRDLVKDMTGYAVGPAMRGVSYLVSRVFPQKEQPRSLADHLQTDRLRDAYADMATYGLVSTVNNNAIDQLRDRFIRTYRTIASKELGIAPDQLTYQDFKRCKNPLVKYAYKELNRSIRMSQLSDAAFFLGALIPFGEDFIVRPMLEQRSRSSINDKAKALGLSVEDVNGLDAWVRFQMQQERERKRSPLTEETIGDDQMRQALGLSPNEKLGTAAPVVSEMWRKAYEENADAANALLKSIREQISLDLHEYSPKTKSFGNSFGMAAKAIYFFTESQKSSASSYTDLQKLASACGFPGFSDVVSDGSVATQDMAMKASESVEKIAGSVSFSTVANVYNHFVDEYYRHHPEKRHDRDREEARRDGKPEPKQSRWQRFKQWVGGLFGGRHPDEDGLLYDVPSPVRNTDKYSRGVFTLMAELLERTYNAIYEANGSRMQFHLDDFMEVIGRGWVNVDHPEITENIVRAISITTNGVEQVQARIDALRQANAGKVPSPEVMKKEMHKLYQEIVDTELTKLNVPPQVTIQLVEGGGKTQDGQQQPVEQFVMNTRDAAEILGPTRLLHYLEETMRSKKQPVVTEHKTVYTFTREAWNTGLWWKLQERTVKETNNDMLLREPEEAIAMLKAALPEVDMSALANMNVGRGYKNETRDGVSGTTFKRAGESGVSDTSAKEAGRTEKSRINVGGDGLSEPVTREQQAASERALGMAVSA